MKMDMVTPCDNCPFRRKGFIPLSQSRVREIAGALLRDRSWFECHKTVKHDDDDEEGEAVIRHPGQQHCAGALMFLERQDRPSQLMRVYERTGGYDRRKLTDMKVVFANLTEMLAAHKKRLNR